jgi:SAM-dependent methyltransferase
LVNRLYIHPLVSGTADTGWLSYVARQHFPKPVGLALSLGCGGGGLERHGFDLKIAREFHGLDVAQDAIAMAQELARHPRKRRIRYEVADLNTLVLPENRFNTVFASQSVHHITALEHYLDQVRRTLKPGGLFIFNEFVGATQFQWPDAQLAHANAMLARIPERYRDSIRGHGLKTHIERPTLELMNQIDPTEAIRSADILAEVDARFELVEARDFGGTLLQLVLEDIVGNFRDTPEDIAVLQSLFDEEQALLASGALRSDFTLRVMRNAK